MKVTQIYVAQNGNYVELSGGRKVAAMLPVAKGEKESLAYCTDGTIARVTGQRINGIGVPRFLQEAGYVLAQAGDANAEALANVAYRRDAIVFVEKALADRGYKLQQELAGKQAWAVPFSPDESVRQLQVDESRGYGSIVLEFGVGISGTTVRAKFDINNPKGDPNLLKSWVFGTEEEANAAPRLTEYGGPIEHAAFVLVNAGLASPEGELALLPGGESGDYYRGKLLLKLNDSDKLLVGVNGVDELEVSYLRNDEVIYKDEEGMSDIALGKIVGDLASVIVRVADMDAAASKKKRVSKKAA